MVRCRRAETAVQHASQSRERPGPPGGQPWGVGGGGYPGYQPHTTRSSWSPWRLDLDMPPEKACSHRRFTDGAGAREGAWAAGEGWWKQNPFSSRPAPRLPLSRLAEQMQDRGALSAEEVAQPLQRSGGAGEGRGSWEPTGGSLQELLGTRSAEPGQGGRREPSSGGGEAQNACLVGP